MTFSRIIFRQILLCGCFLLGLTTHLNGKFMLGIDVLEGRKFSDLRHKKVGILTHNGARNSKNKPTLNIFLEQKEFQLKAVFFPEHNEGSTRTSNVISKTKTFQLGSITPTGNGEEMVNRQQLESRGIKVYDTHTPNRRGPEPQWLDGLDVMVIDLQDIGMRYYTYAASMLHMISACFNKGIEVMILDRPNPLGSYIGGPMMNKDYLSFLGMIKDEPLFHGMTIAEKANYIKNRKENFEVKCNCGSKNCAHGVFCDVAHLRKGKLTIIKMQGWNRSNTLTRLGIYKNDSFMPLSPNIQNVAGIFEYAIISLATLTNKESSIDFLKTEKFLQDPKQSFKYILTKIPSSEILTKIKKKYPRALGGCSLSIIKQNNQDYLVVSVTDITKTEPALLSLILIAQAQEWIPECDWIAFREKSSPSIPQKPTDTGIIITLPKAEVPQKLTGMSIIASQKAEVPQKPNIACVAVPLKTETSPNPNVIRVAASSKEGTIQQSIAKDNSFNLSDLKKLSLTQQKALRKAKWDRLSKGKKDLLQTHIGDQELVKQLFNGESIDVNYFSSKWKRVATAFYHETKKYYLY